MFFVQPFRMRQKLFGGLASVSVISVASAGNPFATQVVAYDAGIGTNPDYNNPTTALGSATRMTGELAGYPSVVSPFSPAFGTDEIVSVGFGGSITLRFENTIRNAANHLFGIDFIAFGNAGLIDTNFPQGEVGQTPMMFGVGAAVLVEASADGQNWFAVETRHFDLMPTLGYRDTGPFDGEPGADRTNFRVAMDPTISLNGLAGLGYAELIELYGASGGGVGFDLAGTGLEEASLLRFSHAGSMGETFELDAVSVVPGPGSAVVLAMGFVSVMRRRRNGVSGERH